MTPPRIGVVIAVNMNFKIANILQSCHPEIQDGLQILNKYTVVVSCMDDQHHVTLPEKKS